MILDKSPDSIAADSSKEKINVALISIGAALFLIASKAIVGVLTGSLALLADASHSGLDLLASLVTAFSVKAADKPPDRSHHYGHGKIESLSALFEAALLFGACIWIFNEGVTRLQEGGAIPGVNIYSFCVIIMAIGIDYYRYRRLMAVARKHHSQALEADAIHFYSDILSSCLVLVGLAFVALGYPKADAIAAIFVAVWVGWLSVRLAKKNLDILIDRVPDEYVRKVRDITLSTESVLTIDQLRLRRSGSSLFADMRVGMDRSLSFIEAHQKAYELEKTLAESVPNLDVVVHMNPMAAPTESLDLGILSFINSRGLHAHHLFMHRAHRKYIVELHLEVDGEMSLNDAHALASDLEIKILKRFGDIESVEIHIEEQADISVNGHHEAVLQPELAEKIESICAEELGDQRCHALLLTGKSGHLRASMHCLFPGDLSVREVHQRTTALENKLLSYIDDLDTIHIHAEPSA